MNKEKQIEEMAKDLGIAFQLAGTTRFGEVAEVLVNAGYRKASEVAREIFEDIFYHTCYSNIGLIIEHGTLLTLQKKYTEDKENAD